MSIHQLRAAVQYSRIAKRGRVYGDGKFVLGIHCGEQPKILLYPTAEARQRKLEQIERGCGYGCMGDHQITELEDD
jgi:hypothetical protein